MRIYLAHEHDERRRDIEACMQLLGHSVDVSTMIPAALLQLCLSSPPDIAICAASLRAPTSSVPSIDWLATELAAGGRNGEIRHGPLPNVDP